MNIEVIMYLIPGKPRAKISVIKTGKAQRQNTYKNYSRCVPVNV